MTTFKRNFKFEENIMVRVSKNIRKYRKIANITQEQLAVDVETRFSILKIWF